MSADRQLWLPFVDDGEPLQRRLSRGTRLTALVIAVVLLGFVAMAAGASLFGSPPTPDNTRPLPRVTPIQGAIH